MLLVKLQLSSFWLVWAGIKNLVVVPEGEGEVCGIGIALSDQEGPISSPGLRTVIMDLPLRHHPAVRHVTVKPRLRIVQILILRKTTKTLH